MKKLKHFPKKGVVQLQVETADDLWYLSHIIEPGDVVRGKATRKIKKGNADQKGSVAKKTLTLSITVEKVDLSASDQLRVSGPITMEMEDIPVGSYQSINLELGSIFTLTKERWLSYQQKKLAEATEDKVLPVLVCVHDREEADFALLKKYGYDMLVHLSGDVEKKREEAAPGKDFYKQIADQLTDYNTRYTLNAIVLASPAFFKEAVMKKLDAGVKKKVILATCSSIGKNGINEVLKRDEVQTALAKERVSKELAVMENVLTAIAKEDAVAYGIDEVEHAVQAGAVRQLLVTETYLFSSKEEGTYERLDALLLQVEQMRGEIIIVSSDHEGGKRLDGLGGIAALLRYKIQ